MPDESQGLIKDIEYTVGADYNDMWHIYLSELRGVWHINRFKLSESKAYEKQSEAFEQIKSPAYYDNSKGSIYKFAENHGLNSYEFDIVKRIVRSRKKGNFKEDLEKTKNLIDLYLLEYEEITRLT